MEALQRQRCCLPSKKKKMVNVGVASVFRYSAGLASWTRKELDKITQMWVMGIQADQRTIQCFIDIRQEGGCRGRLSAKEEWGSDALDQIGAFGILTRSLSSLCISCNNHASIEVVQPRAGLIVNRQNCMA